MMFKNTVNKEDWFNTKIYTTDVILWSFYAELNGLNLAVLFGQGTLFVSKECQGLAVFENGLEELAGTYLISAFSKETHVDKCEDYRDVTEKVKELYQKSLNNN